MGRKMRRKRKPLTIWDIKEAYVTAFDDAVAAIASAQTKRRQWLRELGVVK